MGGISVQDSSSTAGSERNIAVKGTNGSAHVLGGTSGGTAGTTITSFPHTLGVFTSDATGTTYNMPSGRATFQATNDFNGGSALTVTVNIEVKNDTDSNWITLGTISLSGDDDTDGFAVDAPWAYVRARTSGGTYTGSTPTVTVTMGI